MKVAVLGLGRMGQALAGRLIDAGHQTSVWNRNSGRAGELVERGAREAASVVDAVDGAEAVLVSLSGEDAVREVLLPEGKPVLGLDGVLIDCSTVSPATSREVADSYSAHFVACPIAGAPATVQAGTAMLIIGGPAEAIDRAGPAFDALSQTRQDAGADPGTAAIIKLLNNYLLLGGLAVLADVVAVGQANGFDDADLSELLNNLPVIAPGLKSRIDGLISRDHDPWFSIALASRDLGLFADIAERLGVRPGVAEATRSRYREAVEAGFGDQDLTALIETLRRSAAEPVD